MLGFLFNETNSFNHKFLFGFYGEKLQRSTFFFILPEVILGDFYVLRMRRRTQNWIFFVNLNQSSLFFESFFFPLSGGGG